MPEQMKELGALWKKESKNGEKYLTGLINLKAIGLTDKDVNLVIFSNKNKKAENHPDLRVYFSEPRNGSAPRTAASKPKASAPKSAAPAAAPSDSDGML